MSTFLSADLDTSWFTPADNRHMVPRIRQLQALYDHRTCKIRVLIAPNGSGKSTLLQQYFSQHSEPCAWLTLQGEDVSANCFFIHLTTSIRRIHPEFQGSVLCHEFGNPKQPPNLFFGLFYEALAALTSPLTIIIDDAHVLEETSWQQQLFEGMLKAPNVNWIIATNSRATLPQTPEFDEQCYVLTQEHLYFTKRELEVFLSKNAAHQPFNDLIIKSTQGWPAGVKMAQLCLSRYGADVVDLSLPTRTLFTTLADFLIDKLDQETRGFLTQTAFLDRFNEAMCQHFVRGVQSSAAIATLLDTRFLLEIIPEHPLSYQYNPLIKERLLVRFKQRPEQERERLVSAACTWLTEQGFRFDGCITAAHHPHPVVQVEYFLRNLVFWLRSGNLQALYQRFTNPQAPSLKTLPQARVAWCWLLAMTGRLKEAEAELMALIGSRSLSDILSNPENATEANCAVALGVIRSQQGHFEDSLLQQLQQLTRHPQIYTSLRATLTCLLAETFLRRFQLKDATEQAEHTAGVAEDLGYEYTLCVANQIGIRLRYLNNEQSKALALSQAQRNRQSPYPQGIGTALLNVIHGYLLYKNQDRKNGLALCMAECGISLPWLHTDMQVMVYQTLAREFIQQGKPLLAKQLLHFVADVASASGSDRYVAQIALEQFRFSLIEKDAPAALALASSLNLESRIKESLAEPTQQDWQSRFSWLLSGVLVRKTCGDFPAALELSKRLLYLNVESGYPLHFLPLSLLTPWLDFCAGNRTAAYIKLNDVLGQASLSGIRPGLFDDIPGIEELVNNALASDRIPNQAYRAALIELGFAARPS